MNMFGATDVHRQTQKTQTTLLSIKAAKKWSTCTKKLNNDQQKLYSVHSLRLSIKYIVLTEGKSSCYLQGEKLRCNHDKSSFIHCISNRIIIPHHKVPVDDITSPSLHQQSLSQFQLLSVHQWSYSYAEMLLDQYPFHISMNKTSSVLGMFSIRYFQC